MRIEQTSALFVCNSTIAECCFRRGSFPLFSQPHCQYFPPIFRLFPSLFLDYLGLLQTLLLNHPGRQEADGQLTTFNIGSVNLLNAILPATLRIGCKYRQSVINCRIVKRNS